VCRLTAPVAPEFALTLMVAGQYKLTTTRVLDHEGGRNAYQVRVECTDQGNPPLSTNATIPVIVLDVNDNSPKFLTSQHAMLIYENNAPDALILEVSQALYSTKDAFIYITVINQ